MASIFIIDDHPVARLAVRMLLENAGHQIVGEVDDGLRALQHIRNMQPTPDIVVVDLDIPGLSGIDHADNRRAIVAVEQILILRQGVHQLIEVDLVAQLLHHLPCLVGTLLIAAQ